MRTIDEIIVEVEVELVQEIISDIKSHKYNCITSDGGRSGDKIRPTKTLFELSAESMMIVS